MVDSTHLAKLSSKSWEEWNQRYLESHEASPPHIQAVVRVRQALNPGSEETKRQGVKDLQASVEVDTVTLEEVVEGLRLLNEIGAGRDQEVREQYMQAARKRWPEATVLQTP